MIDYEKKIEKYRPFLNWLLDTKLPPDIDGAEVQNFIMNLTNTQFLAYYLEFKQITKNISKGDIYERCKEN